MKPLGFTLEDMKRLLDSLEILADASDDSSHTAATEFIADCHTRAEDSCRHLRKQLAYAEELTALLADHARRP